ncbi:hypothetical protein D6792_00300 [Candidatus Parcubacteria bacterium]|nr:MAG: hypothetical protein D6792_00300 [Candidatus Parcubacteria bacterium]
MRDSVYSLGEALIAALLTFLKMLGAPFSIWRKDFPMYEELKSANPHFWNSRPLRRCFARVSARARESDVRNVVGGWW